MLALGDGLTEALSELLGLELVLELVEPLMLEDRLPVFDGLADSEVLVDAEMLEEPVSLGLADSETDGELLTLDDGL